MRSRQNAYSSSERVILRYEVPRKDAHRRRNVQLGVHVPIQNRGVEGYVHNEIKKSRTRAGAPSFGYSGRVGDIDDVAGSHQSSVARLSRSLTLAVLKRDRLGSVKRGPDREP